MDRRKFIAVGATALIAGCDGDGDGTETPTGENPGDGTDTPDDGNEGNGNNGGNEDTPTEESTVTPGGSWEPDSVTFESCTEFTVVADDYNAVFVALADGSVQQFEEGYSGENSFETEGPIQEINVYSDDGRYDHPNPDASECREE